MRAFVCGDQHPNARGCRGWDVMGNVTTRVFERLAKAHMARVGSRVGSRAGFAAGTLAGATQMTRAWTAKLGVLLAVATCFGATLTGCGQGGRGGDPFDSGVTRIVDAVAAEVNGTPIFVSDVKREAIALQLLDPADPLDPDSARFSEILEELIHRRIFALEARRRGLHETQESRLRIASAREQILYDIIIESVIDEAVTEQALRTLFDEQVRLKVLGDEVRARHIVVADSAKAHEVASLARASNADFRKLALDYSLDDMTRFEGGDLGYFATGELQFPQIENVAFNTPVGEVSDPFESMLGWTVVKVEDRRPEELPSFEELRPSLVRFLTYEELSKLADVLEGAAEVRRRTGSVRD